MMSEPQLKLPVDLERIHDITNGNTVLIQQLADDYFLQATEIIRNLDQAIQSQSIEMIKRLTHKLRGSSATFGITSVRSLSQKIEESIEESDFNSASQLLKDTFDALEESRMFIKSYLI